jgi:hypothetical protein
MFAVTPWITPNGFVSAAREASDRFISHNPGGFSGLNPPIEYPVITGWVLVPSKSIRQKSNTMIPLPSGLVGHPTSTPVVGSIANLWSVGPS